MWMMPLHLHVNQKSDYDDDDMMILSKQFKQNTCNIQFIKSFPFKIWDLLTSGGGKSDKETCAQAHLFLYRIYHLPRFINPIFQMERLINSISSLSHFNCFELVCSTVDSKLDA